ncbi:MAG: hypothetical protein J1F35_07870 [Erysipelotrichales bacterium]|nr:hypothetical protein [Erysipelotrichales bacterium]
MEDNNVNQNDSSKIILLVTLIVVVSILLIGFVFIAVLDLTHKEAETHLKTTTRRTVSTIEKITTEQLHEKDEEEPTTTQTTATTKPTLTNSPSTTKKVVTTTQPVADEDEIIIPASSYEIATSASTFTDAVDSWEWEIVNLINAERKKNGLNELAVAKELRDIAEYGAYLYYENGETAAKDYLINYSNYRMYSNLNVSAKDLYTSTLNSNYAKQVITNQYLKYLGVGVVKKNTGLNTYFYVLIYE